MEIRKTDKGQNMEKEAGSMCNLLRMDLYRLKRSWSVYFCFGILLLMTAATFLMVWLAGTEEGGKTAVKIGMMTAAQAAEHGSLEGVDLLRLFRRMGLSGGVYNMMLGIQVMLFVCSDYQSGFVKNIMALHQNRWSYAGSKILTAGIVNICYLTGQFAFVLLVNARFGHMVPGVGIRDSLFFISWAWMATTAFAALMVCICIWSRSVAAGTLAAVLLGTGSVVEPLRMFLDVFHLGGWLDDSIYLTLSMGPDRYETVSDLYVYLVGAGFLGIYTVVTGVVLKKQDI